MAESPAHCKYNVIPIVMGVCGSGKSTVGKALAQAAGLPYLEADDFHSAANVEKMAQGIALTDADRWPWLKTLCNAVVEQSDRCGGVVATCSALKYSYRRFLQENTQRTLLFIYLDGNRETLYSRMQHRSNHYMPASLLDSQLSVLEKPQAHEPALTLSIEESVETLVATALAAMDKH